MIKATKKNITLLSTMLMGPISLSLLIISVYIIQPKVEAKLTSKVTSVLQANNISAEVSFSGRDGILKGEVDSQEISESAEILSLSVFGTRTIRNQLNVKTIPQIKPSALVPSPVIKETSTLVPPKKMASDNKVAVVTAIVEIEKSNQLSDIDRIIANMQNQSLLKPKYKSSVVVAEEKPIKIASIRLVSIKASEKIPKVIKADSSEEQTKSVVTISNDVNNLEKVTQEKKVIYNESTALLDIIEDFNTFLEPPSSKEKVSLLKSIKKEDTRVTRTLNNIDLSAIHFTDKPVALSKKSYLTLDQVSKSIETYYQAPIDLIIYANDSDIAYARGVAIRNYLVKKGVKRSKIGVAGHTITADKGKVMPIIIKVRE